MGPTLAIKQDVPTGISYKRASDAVNAEAKASLEKALSEPGKAPARFAKSAVIVGAMLWKEIEPTADISLREAEHLGVMIQTSKPIRAQGRKILTDARERRFGKSYGNYILS